MVGSPACSTPTFARDGWICRSENAAAAGRGRRPVASALAALDAAWEEEMARRGLAAATREAYGRVTRGYLVFLEQRGISDLAEADGSSVLAFLESLLDRWAKSSLFWV